MSIIAARIDNRLLHGITATQWAPLYGPQRVMIIDDATANDPISKEGMRMSKPAGMALSIINKETAYANFQSGKYDQHTVFCVVNDPQIILDLINLGQKIPVLVVGGTVDPEEKEFTRVNKRACVTKKQEVIYQKIKESGTKITVQYVPTDKEVLLEELVQL